MPNAASKHPATVGRQAKRRGVSRPLAPGQRLVTVFPQFAEIIGSSRNTAWRLVYDGAIPTVTVGRRRFVDVRDIEKFIEAHKR